MIPWELWFILFFKHKYIKTKSSYASVMNKNRKITHKNFHLLQRDLVLELNQAGNLDEGCNFWSVCGRAHRAWQSLHHGTLDINQDPASALIYVFFFHFLGSFSDLRFFLFCK